MTSPGAAFDGERSFAIDTTVRQCRRPACTRIIPADANARRVFCSPLCRHKWRYERTLGHQPRRYQPRLGARMTRTADAVPR
jgi:hypothetical protein